MDHLGIASRVYRRAVNSVLKKISFKIHLTAKNLSFPKIVDIGVVIAYAFHSNICKEQNFC